MIFTLAQLRKLTEVFCLKTGTSPRQLGLAVGNPDVVKRLLADGGIRASSAETLSAWLQSNWPADVEWPQEVRRN